VKPTLARLKFFIMCATSSARCLAAVLACALTTLAYAQTDKDTVRWDDRAGQWVYTLYNPADLNRYQEVRYTPRTLIEPKIKSSVRRDMDAYEYRYRVTNSLGARQFISSLSVRAPKWDAEAVKRTPLQPGLTGSQIVAIGRAEVAADEAFVARVLQSPNRWKPFLNVNRPTRVVFGWLVDYQKGYSGIGTYVTLGGFNVLRSELPGAAWMELQGDTPDLYNAATLPRSGAVAEQVSQMLADDSVYVPVLVPAIVIPNPYNGVELARRLKAHVATWPDAGLMTADRFAAVTPKLDELISALSTNDKKAAKAAASAIVSEIRKHHRDLIDSNFEDDDEGFDSKPDKRKYISERGTLDEVSDTIQPIHQVAARALAFDLRYLIERLGSGS
jgi:hypothetical protein